MKTETVQVTLRRNGHASIFDQVGRVHGVRLRVLRGVVTGTCARLWLELQGHPGRVAVLHRHLASLGEVEPVPDVMVAGVLP